jgi:hypothetical protein
MAAKIDYNQIREMIGTVISDGTREYVLADYSMGNEMFQAWCKDRQRFYNIGPSAIGQLFTIVSGS